MAKIELDEDQVAILLSVIEGIMPTRGFRRGIDVLEEAIENSTRTWQPDSSDFEYSTVKIAPVYLQLLKHAGRWRDADGNSVLFAENLADFVLALREARVAIARERGVTGGGRHA